MVCLLAALIAAPVYDLETLPLDGAFLHLNDAGTVVGTSFPPVTWDGKVARPLSKNVEDASDFHIAADGMIFGRRLKADGQGYEIFQLVGDALKILPCLNNKKTASFQSISPGGRVAGYCGEENGARPCYWKSGQIWELGLLPGDTSGKATAINDAGVIVGTSKDHLSHETPVIYRDLDPDRASIPTALRLPPNYDWGQPRAINANGTVAGNVAGKFGRGAVWQDEKVALLPPLPEFSQCRVNAINNAGDVVGSSGPPIPLGDGGLPDAFYEWHAVLWKDGTAYDLNNLLRKKNPKLRLLSADSINQRGQIAGTAWTGSKKPGEAFITYLLTPVSK